MIWGHSVHSDWYAYASRQNALNDLWCRLSSSYPGDLMRSMTFGAVNKLFTSVRSSYPGCVGYVGAICCVPVGCLVGCGVVARG